MRTPLAKSVKKLSPQSTAARSIKSSSKAKLTRLKPATKRSPAGKARAQKATNTKAAKSKFKPASHSVKAAHSVKNARTTAVSTAKKSAKIQPRPTIRAKSIAKTRPVHAKSLSVLKRPAPVLPRPQPTRDEAAALRAFEAAHREFSRGHFAEARTRFRALVEKYSSVSEVSARARTYLAIADARLRTELALPRDADSLYDRGVIELNRGDYVAAQELFERALRREPEAAHIHYGLAATRARLGAIDTALKSLERALDLQPSLRIRAQRDQDLNPLRSDPDFEQLVFASRE
ncbi:MAG: tetratricopeptide repeat protein [Pyrinomonadaceae bacterium]